MPKRITALTKDQESRFTQYVQMYTKIGLCCDEADWETFEDGVRRCYQYAELEPPKVFVRVESPIVLAFAASIAAYVIAELRSPNKTKRSAVDSAVDSAVGSAVDSAVDSAVYSAVRSAVYSAVRSAVYSAVGSAVDSAVGSAVYSAVDSAVGSAVGSAVRSAVRSAVGSAVGSAVYSAVRSAVRSAVYSAVDSAVDSAVGSAVPKLYYLLLGGQFWVSWQGFCAFLRDVCKLEFDSDIWGREKAYADAQTSAGWWWPHKDFVMVCNRPEFIKRDEQGRLHSDRSMSIRFRDGWGLYHWHGVEVASQIIMKPWEITAKQALGEKNAEVRRVMIERIGMERFVQESGAREVHRHDRGTLFEIGLGDDPERVLKAVRVTCPSTGRLYFLRVPPEINRADDAIAWSFGFDLAKDYRPISET